MGSSRRRRSPVSSPDFAVVGTIRAVTVEDVTDRLYGLPLAEFTRARNEAAAELRKAGRRDAADEIKALRKPTASAAAANRLVRGHRTDVEGFLAAAAAGQAAQFGGPGDQIGRAPGRE